MDDRKNISGIKTEREEEHMGQTLHELKILPEYFEAVKRGYKRFELRKDDRDYKVGDALLLHEWDGEKFTGRHVGYFTITCILRNCEEYGLKEGYCIIGF